MTEKLWVLLHQIYIVSYVPLLRLKPRLYSPRCPSCDWPQFNHRSFKQPGLILLHTISNNSTLTNSSWSDLQNQGEGINTARFLAFTMVRTDKRCEFEQQQTAARRSIPNASSKTRKSYSFLYIKDSMQSSLILWFNSSDNISGKAFEFHVIFSILVSLYLRDISSYLSIKCQNWPNRPIRAWY